MACSKYTLTNTGTTVINFNYRRCDDSMWEYQVELYPNQTKNIWLMDNTFSIAPLYNTNLVLEDNGVFPPVYVTPTPTPTPSVTPSNTPTQTTTPSVTPTNTGTPPVTPTNTSTPTNTQTNTGTPNATSTPTATLGLTPTATETQTPTPTNTQTGTPAETPTNTPTNTQTGTPAETPTNTPTNTQTGTPNVTPTPSTTIGATPTQTETQTPTPTVTATETPTNTPTNTQTGTAAVTPTPTNTETAAVTPTPTNTETAAVTPTPTNTETAAVTPTPTNTETAAVTPTPTNTGTPNVTPTQTTTTTPTPTPTPTPAFSVLYIGGSNAADEALSIQDYLSSTGYSSTFSAVTLDASYTGDGGITLANYDTIVMYTTDSFSGSPYSSTLSTAIYDYVSSGGNFVSGARLWSSYPSGFNHSELTAYNERNTIGTVFAGNTIWVNQVLSNPITSGLTNSGFGSSISINGSSSSTPATPIALSTGSKSLATWVSPSYSAMAYKKVSGATLVSINAYVANLTTFTSSTMNELYGNSILLSLGLLPEPTTFVYVENYDSSSASTITGVTISGVTGSSPLGQPTSGDGFPLLFSQFNSGFTTSNWSSNYTAQVGIDLQSVPSGTIDLTVTDSNGIQYTQTITSSGTYTFTGLYISSLVPPQPTNKLDIRTSYTP